jgi:hypothetical protein
VLLWTLAATAAIAWLLLYKLGSLTGGLSRTELTTATTPLGWHGLYHDPLYLPLKVVRSAVFFMFPDHGQTLTRLPNVVFGALAIVGFGGVIRLWHGRRTGLLMLAMFAAAAWTLHISRFASYDVLYLWALPTLVCSHFLLRKYSDRWYIWYGNILVWGLLIYIPGLVWFVLLDMVLQRRFLLEGWREHGRWWQRILSVLLALGWLPLLIHGLLRGSDQLKLWLGWPEHLATGTALVKQFAGVPVHLFIRGPQYPELWLGKAPILDIFALAAFVLGLYFYITHLKAARTRYLAVLSVIGFVLVGLGGAVPLSVLVPLVYMVAATGVAYLLRQWLKTFPSNPLARGLGVGLIALAVALSCMYNYRAYFIAWPHTAATRAAFHYRYHP